VVLGSEVYTNTIEYGELAEDLLVIVTVFVARHDGLLSAANRRRRREVAQEVQGFKRFKKEVKKLSAGKVQRIHGRKRKYQTRKEGSTRIMSQRQKRQ